MLNISCYYFIVSYSFILSTPPLLFSSPTYSVVHPAVPGLQQLSLPAHIPTTSDILLVS